MILKKGHTNHQYWSDQNDNQLLVCILFEIWILKFGIYLEFGACDLLFPVYPG